MSKTRRRVLTTGCNSGLGLATVLELARRGHDSIGTVRTAVKAEIVAEAAERAGVEVTTRILDVTDADACAAVVGELEPDVPESLLAQNLFGTFFRYLTVWLGGRSSALERGDARVRAALDLQLRGLRVKRAVTRSRKR